MRGVTRRFPGVLALDGVDLDVRAGEAHVVLGENGAGKSTLIKILAGAVRRDAGEILLDGRSVELRGPAHARSLGISVIHQELTLVPHLSVADNVFLGRFPSRAGGWVKRRLMEERATTLLRGLGVDIDPRIPVRRLGLAEQQGVEIARALADEARILVMDEPTSALTAIEVDRLVATIERLTDRGVAVIYVSHRMEELFRVGHRVTVLRDGKYVATLQLDQTNPAELVRLMTNREVSDHFPRRRVARGDEVLRVEGLSRAGSLHDVSFTLHRGEVLGLAGLIGAGRTELARCLVGADPIDAGRIVLKGRAAVLPSPRAAIAHGLALLPEDRKSHGLVLGATLQHNIGLPVAGRFSRWGFVDTGREAALARTWCERLRVKTSGIDRAASSLSGGNQQKVVLAKWLAAEADVLLFDEPTRGIDLGARRDIHEIVNALVANGVAVLMISSELDEVLGMSDRVLVMRGGRLCAEFPAASTTESQLLQAALGVAS
jgi:ribose transport system ATP-binding protein